MSLLLGLTVTTIQTSQLNDSEDAHVIKSFQWNNRIDIVFNSAWLPGVLWSGSAGMGGQLGWQGFQDSFDQTLARWDVELSQVGGQQALKLRGTSRDSSGNPLANAIIRGYVTSTNAYEGQVTSDNGGYFELPCSAGAVAHYLVAFKAGSPDIAGTTDNTLIPV